MISISGVDAETGKICEIHCKNYEQLLFKLERGSEKKPDKFLIFVISEGKYYLTPEEEFQTHLSEAEIEDENCNEIEVELEGGEAEEVLACSLIPKWFTLSDWSEAICPNLSPKEWTIALNSWNAARAVEEFEETS